MNSKYFKREEFSCSCGCGFQAVDVELLEILTDIREFFDKPVTINSACRCEKHNKSIGGSKNSQHTKGMACDIVVQDVNPANVQQYVLGKYEDSKGIGLYGAFTHIDVRPNKSRWNG